ncbi:MAG: phenylacetate-CoA oxygenase subunit PaaC [Acidimicrobiia bacterium]|nr:MAG: phenylacetate-CoA oxygenase subunit PaaC [Acidimicrobiia bacterium]
MNMVTTQNPLATYIVRHADDNVVLGQRLAEYVSRAPELEEDLAVSNLALDHIGVADHMFTYAAKVEGGDASGDVLVMFRSEREYTNVLLVEQPQHGFDDVMARQFLFDAYQLPLWEALSNSTDDTIAGIAQRAAKEATYHLRHSSGWVIRLGDGTDESHERMQNAIDRMWRFTSEMFEADDLDRRTTSEGVGADPSTLRESWASKVDAVLEQATLTRPEDSFQTSGGRTGIHTEHLGPMLAEMQWLQRANPGLAW